MNVCDKCKDREHCKGLPGICLKLPCILTGIIAVMIVVLIFNSSL